MNTTWRSCQLQRLFGDRHCSRWRCWRMPRTSPAPFPPDAVQVPERVLVGAGARRRAGRRRDERDAGVEPGRKFALLGRNFAWLATLRSSGPGDDSAGACRSPAAMSNLLRFVCAAVRDAAPPSAGESLRRRRPAWLRIFIVTPALLLLLLAIKAFYTEASSLMPAWGPIGWHPREHGDHLRRRLHPILGRPSPGCICYSTVRVAAAAAAASRRPDARHMARALPSAGRAERMSYSPISSPSRCGPSPSSPARSGAQAGVPLELGTWRSLVVHHLGGVCRFHSVSGKCYHRRDPAEGPTDRARWVRL